MTPLTMLLIIILALAALFALAHVVGRVLAAGARHYPEAPLRVRDVGDGEEFGGEYDG